MSAEERKKMLQAVVARAPGKRQIKPTAALFGEEEFASADGEDDDDTNFSANSSTVGSTSDDEEEEEDVSDEEGNGSYASGSERGEDQLLPEDQKDDDVSISTPSTSAAAHKHLAGDSAGQTLANAGPVSSPLCAVCLNLRPPDQLGEVIQCDRCGLAVHESCYGAVDEQQQQQAHLPNASEALTAIKMEAVDTQSEDSSASTEPWFCEPCLFSSSDTSTTTPPHCELCPSRYGAFKRSDIGGGWVHLVCALFTPGLSFAEVDRLSAVSWQEIDYRNFGRKVCGGCADQLEARTGVTVKCDAGLCKNFYHVTCAQKLGLLVDLESEAHRRNAHHQHSHHGKAHSSSGAVPMQQHTETGYLYCRRHAHNEAALHQLKNAYAKFVVQEERRLAQFSRVHLDARQERKRQTQLADYKRSVQRYEGSIITLPVQKRARLLHTSARYVEEFAEKAEMLIGMTRAQFAEEFVMVPPAQLPPNLAPTFSKQFCSYMEHRDNATIGEEEARLERLKRDKASKLREQSGTEQRLAKTRKEHSQTDAKFDEEQHLFERFKAALAKIAPHSPLLTEQKKQQRLVKRKRSTTAAAKSPPKKAPKMAAEKTTAVKSAPNSPPPTTPVKLLNKTKSPTPAMPTGNNKTTSPPTATANRHSSQTASAAKPTPIATGTSPSSTSLHATPTKQHNLPSFEAKVSSPLYLLEHANIGTSLLSKFGMADKQFTPLGANGATAVVPVSPSKTRPNILAKSGDPKSKTAQQHSVALARKEPTTSPPLHSSPRPPPECHKCKQSSNPHLLAFCETCRHHYHIGCLDPPLPRMPAKNKFSRFECSDCACPSEAEEGETATAAKDDDGEDAKGKLPDEGEAKKETDVSPDWNLVGMRGKREQRRTKKLVNGLKNHDELASD